MALTITGEEHIATPIETVWAAVNDPEMLRRCIPGCEKLEKKSDTEMTATVVLRIGPMKATFLGEVRLTDLDPPHGCTISGEGKGGIAGFASGNAEVRLVEAGPEATVLSYTAKASVGGKIAQLGSRLIDSTAKKLAAQFFANLADQMKAASSGLSRSSEASALPEI